jgi:hypothetical protein
VLKKAGIIVAATAVGLVTIGSFAFADETVTKDNLSNTCTFGATGSTVTSSNLESATAVGAVIQSVISAVAPVDAQAQALDCNNIGIKDVLDVDSGNVTESVTETEIKDSNNQ